MDALGKEREQSRRIKNPPKASNKISREQKRAQKNNQSLLQFIKTVRPYSIGGIVKILLFISRFETRF